MKQDNIKKIWILSKYYLRSFIRRLPGYTSSLIFLFSFIIFGFTVAPNLFSRPSTLIVSGIVTEAVANQNGNIDIHPISGVIVEIGGFRAISDIYGVYKLEFRSLTRQNIPVVFRRNGQDVLERVGFPLNEGEIQKDYTFK